MIVTHVVLCILEAIMLFVSQTNSVPSFIRHEGAECEMYEGVTGECKFIKQCPEVKCARRNGIPYEKCTMVGHDEVVCCNIDRPSVRACKNYRLKRDQMFSNSNGRSVQKYEFPHMVALGYKESETGIITWNCKGALISDQVVLTAAHCVHNSTRKSPVKVRLGSLNLFQESMGKYFKDFYVQEIITPPGYTNSLKYNDIALLKLSQVVLFTKSIHPACLYTEPNIMPNQVLTVTGWDTTDVGAVIQNLNLRKTNLTELNMDTCNELAKQYNATSLPRGLDSKMLCAASMQTLGFGDTCKRDSGGPLQFKENDTSTLYSIVGITSFGFENKCEGGKPGIYTRVSEFLDWIECNIWHE